MTKTTIELLTAVEAAPQVRLHPKTLRRYAKEGRIGCHRPSSAKLYFTQAHIDQYLAATEHPAETGKPASKPARNPRKTYAS